MKETTVSITASGYWNDSITLECQVLDPARDLGYVSDGEIEDPEDYDEEYELSYTFRSRKDANKFIKDLNLKRKCSWHSGYSFHFEGDSSPYGPDDPWSDLRDDRGRFYLGDGVYV